MLSEPKIHHSIPPVAVFATTRGSGFVEMIFSLSEIHTIAPHEEGAKCAQIAKEWLDKGLAKCHEIAVLYPSSRNPPAWIGKIHGISFVDTSALSSAANPKSNIQNLLFSTAPPDSCSKGVLIFK